MDNTLSSTFSLIEFQQDLAAASPRQLLRWADCHLYMAFVRNVKGHEEPALIQIESSSRYFIATQKERLYTLLEGAQLPEGSEVVLRSLPLNEVARNAHLYRRGIQILDHDHGQYIDGSTTLLLGMSAEIELPEGKFFVYQAELFFFEPLTDAPTLPDGAVQYWYDATPEHQHDAEPGRSTSIYVFDDRLDWSDPLFPELPDGARPLSTLSASAKTFFERTRLPLLKGANEEPAKAIEPERPYHNRFIEREALPSFDRLRAMVDREIVPPNHDVTLQIVKEATQEEEPSNASEYWRLTISFTTPLGFKALFELEQVEASLCQGNPYLPDTTGHHRTSEALRERIVDHLAWVFLHQGRSFDVIRFSDSLNGLLPDHVVNGHSPFQPDYTDHGFPCLARLQCHEYQVPLLLIGQTGDNYIAQPLKSIDIPERFVPTSIPMRSQLIDMNSQVLSFLDSGDKILLPTSLIDFPDSWYDGARISNQNIKSKFSSSMAVNVFLNEIEKQDTEGTSTGVKWILAACAIVIIVTVIMAL